MKKTILTLCLFSSIFADNCDVPRDDFDGLYCLNKIWLEADKEIGISYKKLRSYLSKSEKKVLKTSQLAWIKDRNEKCSYKNEKGFFVNLRCAKESTVARTNILRDRIRECKSTGCQSSKL